MPPYFSAVYQFHNNAVYPSFVRDIYATFFKMGYEFKSGYLLHKNDSLEEIISWNQELLEKKIKLGIKHDSNKEIQILLETDLFDEMRLFWFFTDNYFCLSLIVPEDNMIDNSNQFIEEKLNAIIELSKGLWCTGLIAIVQSFPEIGGCLSLNTIDNGAVPSIEPFCIVCNSLFNKFSNKLTDNYSIERNSCNSTLIFNETFDPRLTFFNTSTTL